MSRNIEFDRIMWSSHPKGKGVMGKIFYPNGYGAVVHRYKITGSQGYASYTCNEREWELAVVTGNHDKCCLTYDTPITNDVIGHLNSNRVNFKLELIKKLPRLV